VDDVPAAFIHRRIADMDNILHKTVSHEERDPSAIWAPDSAIQS
jgi:hypothetical protein